MKVVSMQNEKAIKPATTKAGSKKQHKKSAKKVRWQKKSFSKAKVRGNFLFMLLGIPTKVEVYVPSASKTSKRKK